MNKDINKYEDIIREVVHSFLLMCDFIEEDERLGCPNCPVFYQCFTASKHHNLLDLMNVLGIEKTQGRNRG